MQVELGAVVKGSAEPTPDGARIFFKVQMGPVLPDRSWLLAFEQKAKLYGVEALTPSGPEPVFEVYCAPKQVQAAYEALKTAVAATNSAFANEDQRKAQARAEAEARAAEMVAQANAILDKL